MIFDKVMTKLLYFIISFLLAILLPGTLYYLFSAFALILILIGWWMIDSGKKRGFNK
jgi:hypothetical protein